MAIISRELGIVKGENVSAGEAAEALIKQIEEWTKRLGIPQDLKEFGVKESDVPDLAVAAAKVTRLLNNNPKPVSLSDMEEIYRKLLN
jgi:alcohol dehydrogenase class IV